MMDNHGSLMERIEGGLTTLDDARAVSGLIARLMRYELALREIAVYGGGAHAMLAAQALTRDPATDGAPVAA